MLLSQSRRLKFETVVLCDVGYLDDDEVWSARRVFVKCNQKPILALTENVFDQLNETSSTNIYVRHL